VGIKNLTRTLRRYNLGPILSGPGYRSYVMSNLDNLEIVQEAEWDYFFKRYGYYCCGNCKGCKKYKIKEDLERKAREKRWVEMEIENIDLEEIHPLGIDDYDYDFGFD
jgi:hypothetical protein